MKCQLTYLPLAATKAKEEVQEVLDFIDKCNVDYSAGELSTLVEGDRKEVLELINGLYSRMDDEGKQFRLHVELLSTNDYS